MVSSLCRYSCFSTFLIFLFYICSSWNLTFFNFLSARLSSLGSCGSSDRDDLSLLWRSLAQRPTRAGESRKIRLRVQELVCHLCASFPGLLPSDWIVPCFLWDLINFDNGYWTLWGASYGPGPWGDFNYTVGSWRPSQGVLPTHEHFGMTNKMKELTQFGSMSRP
jgi:hypothetical protein